MTAGGSTVADRQPVAEASQSAARTAMAGLIGNVLEWFDFAVMRTGDPSVAQQ